MVVPNLLFDGILYGGLWLALLLDTFVPALHGAATLIAVGAATYLAAEDGSISLAKRGLWSQDSLATALSISVATFIYFWWRNDADIIAVVLHVGLMMTSLMILISVVAAASLAWSTKSVLPVAGLIVTTISALALGALAGMLIYVLTSATISLGIKIGLLLIGAVSWKVRESVRPPLSNEDYTVARAALTAAAAAAVAAGKRPVAADLEIAHPGASRMLIPQGGTLLDRFLPVLVMCLLVFIAMHGAAGMAIR